MQEVNNPSPVLSAAQEAEVLNISSGAVLDHDRSVTVIDLFKTQVAKTPNSIAVVFEDKQLTYQELDRVTDLLALQLLSIGVKKETIVGVMIDRSEYMVVYPMGILKAGAAYMPLDFTMPSDRLAFMVKDAGVNIIVSEGSRVTDGLPEFRGTVIRTEELPTIYASIDPSAQLTYRPAPADMFVILYTSGSTGMPKGCILEHRNIDNFCQWYVKDFEVVPEDRSVAYANFSFDAHMIDIYPILITGASVYIIPSNMRLDLMRMNKYMNENKLTISFMTTQIGRQFAEDLDNHSLRLLSLGGERLIPTKKPKYKLFNVYGPTECTLFSTFYDIQADYDSAIIGHSLANVQNYIMDKDLNLLPIGVQGELVIGGEGVGRGYLGRDDLNKEKFVEWRGQKLYRSGDQAYYNQDGEIEYVGRMDNQVKLRGLRIELGEIESKMAGFEGIAASVADVKEYGGVQHLCGYYIAKYPINLDAFKDYLRTTLTDFMIPDAFIEMDKFPMTNNGKVNRKILPIPRLQMDEVVPPATPMEEQLFEIVSDLLKIKDFGVTTELFYLGLTSILAIKLSILIEKKLQVSLQTKEILKLKTIRLLAELASSKETATTNELAYPKRDYYPLTETQMGIYYEWEKKRSALQYNLAFSLKFSNSISVDQLKNAVMLVAESHPMLGAILQIADNQIVQRRRDGHPIEITIFKTPESQIKAICTDFVKPFDLFSENLYRFQIHQTEKQVYLLLDIHHIIFDGSSLAIFLENLSDALVGKDIEVESFTGFDIALEEQAMLASEKSVAIASYFEQLLGSTSMFAFPHSSKLEADNSSKDFNSFIPVGAIAGFCQKQGVTESNFFLSVLCQVLQRYARESKLAITTVSSGRADNKLMHSLGMFVKTVPVVAEFKKETVLEFVKRMQEQSFATMEHEDYPFTRMVEKFGIVPQISYAYQGGFDFNINAGGFPVELETLALDTSIFPFGIQIRTATDGYLLNVEYDRTKYSRLDISRFVSAFTAAVTYMSEGPDTLTSDLLLLSANQKNSVLQISEAVKLPYNKAETFLDLFKKQVLKFPNKNAVVDQNSALSFAELDKLSDQLASQLIQMGVVPNSFVAVMLSRSKEFMVSLLAIFKAGGAYVPLDSEYPNDRLIYMLENSQSKLLITESHLLKQKQETGVFKAEQVLLIDQFNFDAAIVVPMVHPQPDQLAYMIYTSGSTGKPKGVMIRHQSLVAFLVWYTHDFSVNENDRFCCHPSFSFDASVIDLFSAISVGGTLYIVPSELRQDMVGFSKYLKAASITGGVFSTQFGMELLNQFDLPLRMVMLGGEKLLAIRKQNTWIINGYGPTEFTIASNYFAVNQSDEIENIPIGKPVANSWSYVLDANRRLLPVGMPGELCLSGVQIAKGYWQREDLTAEKFLDNPYQSSEENAKIYCTGDLVKWNDAGELLYMGRIDTQVKLRGFRIELGEIETMMAKFEGVASAVVDVKEFAGAQHLCGYFTQKAGATVNTQELYGFLKLGLTEYMVPSALINMEALPITPGGKVDRKALPLPEMTRKVEYLAPSNELEEQICRIYEDVLKIEQVGVLDDFFEIGGSSMSAMKAVIQIMNLGNQINYGNIFSLKTPQAIAQFIQESANHANADDAIEDLAAYDYTKINQVLAENKQDLFVDYQDNEVGTTLLTGSTGYLGVHVLKELIDKEQGIIYCMVRSTKDHSPEKRLKIQLMYYFSDTYDHLFETRIKAIDGDITNIDTLDSLKGLGINTVYNCAASVKHFAAGNELDRINVEGVANLVDFCKKEQARLIHVSTVSVSGIMEKQSYDNKTIMHESSLYLGQKIDNLYVLTKYKAERLVLEAISQGLDAKIMRVGNLMGRHSDGEFQINFRSNAFVSALKSYKVMGMFPLSQMANLVEISPIDCVARVVVTLSKTPKKIVLLHAFNNYRLDMANVIYAMKEYGFNMELVSDQRFQEHFQELMQDATKSEHLSGLLHYDLSGNMLEVPVENQYTTLLLYKHQQRWPLTDVTYSKQLIELLDGMGLFDE
jgi:amino acid adenylation domain-containing protein/thioester reductase-like protein